MLSISLLVKIITSSLGDLERDGDTTFVLIMNTYESNVTQKIENG